MSRYVCREHPSEPVTPRGTGCRECEIEARNRPRDRYDSEVPR